MPDFFDSIKLVNMTTDREVARAPSTKSIIRSIHAPPFAIEQYMSENEHSVKYFAESVYTR